MNFIKKKKKIKGGQWPKIDVCSGEGNTEFCSGSCPIKTKTVARKAKWP